MSGIIAAAGITAAAGLASGMLSKSGGGGGGSTQSTSTQTQLPMGIQQRDTDNYDFAMQVANQLMGPYGGQRVADLTPEQRNLIQQLYSRTGSTDQAFDTSMGWTNMLSGYNPQQVQAGQLANTNLNPYMSPYTQSVIDPTMKLMEQQRQQALNQNAASAAQARAFGGSRHGITEAATNAQSELNKGQFAGNLWNQNFLQAQTAAQGDIANRLRADMSNQQYDLEGARFRANIANQYANLASGKQNAWLTGVNAATAGQDMLRGYDQAQLDAAQQLYAEQRQQPLDQLRIRQQAMQASPYGQTSVQTGPGPTSNPWLTGLGTAATTAGLLGQTGAFKKGGWLGDIFGSSNNTPPPMTIDQEIANWSSYGGGARA